MLYPLKFQPIYMERVWGGRNLERLFAKPLPSQIPVGESWEISDRPEGVSVIANGAWAGRDLRWAMEHHAAEVLGRVGLATPRFPLLVKILDAQERLSLQVHPPAEVAARFGGEPKTEMWYVAEARPGAELFVGLRRGVTRAEFTDRLEKGDVTECFHRIPVQVGDAMFLPSGRVHAIGGSLVIFEIQQNSNTTYRVFDWNRKGLDGRPRALHLKESLQSIDFADYEPGLVSVPEQRHGPNRWRRLVDDALFTVDHWSFAESTSWEPGSAGPQILGIVRGSVSVRGPFEELPLQAGDFCLLPAALTSVQLDWITGGELLRAAIC